MRDQERGRGSMTFRLTPGIASAANLGLLIFALPIFPFVTKWTGAFSFATIEANSPQHTPAFLKFCLIVLVSEWLWFLIAWMGIRAGGKVTFTDVLGGKWDNGRAILTDVGLGLVALAIMVAAGALLQMLLARYQHDSVAFRSLLPTNAV
jgi:uncharacterized membrane protein